MYWYKLFNEENEANVNKGKLFYDSQWNDFSWVLGSATGSSGLTSVLVSVN